VQNSRSSGRNQVLNKPESTSMSKRVSAYIADGIYEYLEDWAKKEKRPVGNLAAFLLEQLVREKMEKDEAASK